MEKGGVFRVRVFVLPSHRAMCWSPAVLGTAEHPPEMGSREWIPCFVLLAHTASLYVKLPLSEPICFHTFTLPILCHSHCGGASKWLRGARLPIRVKPQCWLIIFIWYSKSGLPRGKKSTCWIRDKTRIQLHSLTVLLVQMKRRVATVEYQLVFDRPSNTRQRHQQGYTDPVQLQSSPARERQRRWPTGRWRCTYGTGFLLHKTQKYIEHPDTL